MSDNLPNSPSDEESATVLAAEGDAGSEELGDQDLSAAAGGLSVVPRGWDQKKNQKV